jgi:uncharacterized protein involved in exopolysaccharide biosynthesis
MIVSRKSSSPKDLTESQQYQGSEETGFVDDSTGFYDTSRFAKTSRLFFNPKELKNTKISRLFSRSQDFTATKITRLFKKSEKDSDTQILKKYRESVDLDLSRYLGAVKRHWLPATTILLASVALSGLATTRLKPAYEAYGKLLFKTPSFNVVGNNLLPNSQEGTTDLKPLVSTQNPISTQMEIISSPVILQKVIDRLQLKDSKGQPLDVETLEKSLKLKIAGGADVLIPSYKSGNAVEAANVVNTLIDVYLENDVAVNRNEAKATRQLLIKQLPANKAAFDGAEAALRTFKQSNSIVNLTEETKSAVSIIGTLDSQINSVSAELEQLTAQTNKLRQQMAINPQDAMVASEISQSPAVKATLAEIQEIDRQLNAKRAQFKDNSPVIVDLEAKKTNFKALLQQQIVKVGGNKLQSQDGNLQIGELRQSLITSFLQSEVQRLGQAQKLSSLQRSKAGYEQRIKVLPALEQQQRELERRLEVPRNSYQTLLKKIQELQVAEDDSKSTARVISKASVPKEPVASMASMIMLLGLLFGAFLATSLIVLLEMRLNARNLAIDKGKGKVQPISDGKKARQKTTQLKSVNSKYKN